jgi:hypothetical protein
MGATDRDLVLGFRPDARVETRSQLNRHPRTEYRVVYAPAAGARDTRPAGWCPSEAKAWQTACVRLGLRVRRPLQAALLPAVAVPAAEGQRCDS